MNSRCLHLCQISPSLISHALRITSMDAFQVTHQVGLLALLVCACRLCRAVGPARLRLPPASCSLPPWCLPHAPPLDPPEHTQGGGKKGQRRFGWTYAKAFSPPSLPYCNMVDGGNRRSKLPLLPLVPLLVKKAWAVGIRGYQRRIRYASRN